MSRFKRVDWFLAAALLIAIAAALPLMAQPGLLNTRGGGDSPFLLQRLHQLEVALLDGHFPVRWMPDANYGFGYPFYNFYAPLSIYTAVFFRLIGFSFVRSIQISQLAGFIVAAWGMYALGKRWWGNEWAGLLTAVSYTLAPFHLVNVYVRGDSLAEFWAMAFYPLVILTADKLVQGTRCKVQGARDKCDHKSTNIVPFALSYAGLILSHNISALIFSPFLLLFILFRLKKSNHNYPLSTIHYPLSIGFLLAFGLSAWFFLPALIEKDLTQIAAVTEGYFHYSTHFLGTDALTLVQDSFLFDYSVNGRSAFRMGLWQGITAVIATLTLLYVKLRHSPPRPRTKQPSVAAPLLLSIVVATFMMLPASTWLWENVPLLSFTQFPWRFLSVQAFGIALAIGGVALLPWRRWIVPFVIALSFISSFGNLQTDHLILTDANVDAENLAQYEWFTGNMGTTVSAEYLPQTVQPRPYSSRWLTDGVRDRVVAQRGEIVSAQLIERRTAHQTWQIETLPFLRPENPISPVSPRTAIVRFDTMQWPGWVVLVDGVEIDSWASDGSGLITAEIPSGKHTVELKLLRTGVQLLAELISLTVVIVTFWLFVLSLRERGRLFPPPLWGRARVGGGLLILILLALLVHLWPQPFRDDGTLTWDFAQMGYLHHAPDGILFENGAKLNRYEYSAETVVSGQALTITLDWNTPPSDATLSLVSSAANWPDSLSPFPLTALTQSGSETVYQLHIPENAPVGLIVPRLTVANGRSLTPSGETRGVLNLRPVRILNNVPKVEEGVAPLNVRAVHVEQIAPELLSVQLVWLTQRPLSQNYNVALRLTDANGNFSRLVDRQPGYGFQPSSSWPAGQRVNDWHTIPLPPATEGHQFPFALVAQLYDVADRETAVLTRRLGELTRSEDGIIFQPTELLMIMPEGFEPETATSASSVQAVFGNIIQLAGYSITKTEDELQLDLVWHALENGTQEYIRFVHLIDPTQEGAAPLVQNDTMPRNGSYPTSQWTAGEFIQEQVVLPISDLSDGEYQLAVGFYQIVGDAFVRLDVVDGSGDVGGNGRYILPSQ